MSVEVQAKLERLRTQMRASNVDAVRLRGVDWFFWATGGGASWVILTSETGVAEVLVTLKDAWVLTNQIENPRLRLEEVPSQYSVQVFPWQDSRAREAFIGDQVGSGHLASDRPVGAEAQLPESIVELKLILDSGDISKYRKVGRGAAEAMTAALNQAEPEMTELELAALGASELYKRDLDPTLILVGGERRVQIHRHPLPKSEKLGSNAMMVFCARGEGLFANLTRFVYFREPHLDEVKKFQDLRVIESAAFEATRPGATLSKVYSELEQCYLRLGHGAELSNHHQGGPTGYLSREAIATPSSHQGVRDRVQNNMAFAWNPSLSGAKVEDTCLLTETGFEVLTEDPAEPRGLGFIVR